MASTESKVGQSKGLIYIFLALCILVYPIYYFSQPNCNRASDTLLTLLSRDNFNEVNSLEESYKPNLKILDTTRMYLKGDKVVCSAKVNIQVSEEIANRIEELLKQYRTEKDRLNHFEYLPLLKDKTWLSSNRSFSTEVTYEVGSDNVSIGSGDGLMSIAQYYSLVLSIKKIHAEVSKLAGEISDLPPFKQGERYEAVRAEMLAQGWNPFEFPPNRDYYCSDTDTRCHGKTETEACTGAGISQCKYKWTKEGRQAIICTSGEENTFSEYCE